MANSKNPRKTGWFSSGDQLQKKNFKRLPSWRRVRRRCTIAQPARRWNALRKVEGNEVTPNQGETFSAASTDKSGEKLDRQKKSWLTSTTSSDDRVAERVGIRGKQKTSPRSIPTVMGSVPHSPILAQPGATCPKKLPIASNYYQQFIHKNSPYLQLIQRVDSPCIYWQSGYNRGRIQVELPPDSSQIHLQIKLNLSLVNFGFRMKPLLNNCKFSQWARAP